MNIKALILLFAITVTGLSSCKKGNDDVLPVVDNASLSVINASADTLNVYQNGTRLNNTANIVPSGSLPYMLVIVGTQNYQFKKAGSPNTLIDMPFTLNKTTRYTLFVAGETTDKVFLLKDSLITDTTAGKARIRFVNASSGVGSVDVYIGNNFNYNNRTFKSATDFIQVNSGQNILSIYQTGTTTLLAQGTLTLTAGSFYTLYTKGVLNGTGNNAFGVRILTL